MTGRLRPSTLKEHKTCKATEGVPSGKEARFFSLYKFTK